MTDQPASPGNPWQAQAMAQTGGTHLRFHLQGSIWTSSMLTPTVTINGYRVPVKYGLNVIPVHPGRNVIEAKAQWMREYGQASYTVDLAPGQSQDVWYAAPATQFQTGSMGATKQPRKGAAALAVILGGVILLLIVVPTILSGVFST